MKPDAKDYENATPMEESGASKAADYEHVDLPPLPKGDLEQPPRCRSVVTSKEADNLDDHGDPAFGFLADEPDLYEAPKEDLHFHSTIPKAQACGVLIPPAIASGTRYHGSRTNAIGEHFIDSFWAKNGTQFRVIDGELVEVKKGATEVDNLTTRLDALEDSDGDRIRAIEVSLESGGEHEERLKAIYESAVDRIDALENALAVVAGKLDDTSRRFRSILDRLKEIEEEDLVGIRSRIDDNHHVCSRVEMIEGRSTARDAVIAQRLAVGEKAAARIESLNRRIVDLENP